MERDSILLLTFASSCTVFTLLFILAEKMFKMPSDYVKLKEENKRLKALELYWGYLSNYVSIVHAILSIILAAYVVTTYGIVFRKANYIVEDVIITISLGYFVVDTLLSIFFGYGDSLMFFHHIECIVSLLYPVFKGYYGNIIVWAIMIAEISNPFMLLWKNFGIIKKKKLEFYFGIVFSISFLILRTYCIGYVAFPLQSSEVSLLLKLHCGLLWYLSLYWCYIIINLLFKGIYEGTQLKFIGKINQFLKVLRKSTIFQYLLLIALFCVCFLRTFVYWNHIEIL